MRSGIDRIFKRVIFITLPILIFLSCSKKNLDFRHEQLQVSFSGDAKLEVGGPYVGVEFHHSSPLAQRISFFYPLANSIDLSSDYWTRDTTHIMMLGLKIGSSPKEWIGFESFDLELTPFSLSFSKIDSIKSVRVSYHFCKNKPAMIVVYEIKNLTSGRELFEFDTHMDLSLRTCHSFKKKMSAWVNYDKYTSTVYANYTDPETGEASIFVANAGITPEKYGRCGPLKSFLPVDSEGWDTTCAATSVEKPGHPAARFLYRHTLSANESMKIVHIIGSGNQDETAGMVDYLVNNYEQEVAEYENTLLERILTEQVFETGDTIIDHSVKWASAILEVNKHYLDGEFVPMPCPAEYNFYFTHDVLVTDLAAVNFDLPRVRQDLDYIRRHSDEELVIPHAYYWKDSTYVTEYAQKDNWNNFWMIIVTASYLRHSADTLFVNTLYPYLSGCLQRALRTKQEDNLMWSVQPDWWDIGENWGPRSYMTILAIKALRDYIYVSSALGKNLDTLPEYESQAEAMQQALVKHLWNDKMAYLINYYEDKSLDEHYYGGSLLAAHYDLLDKQRRSLLIESAQRHLLDPDLGIYCVYPMDFEQLAEYLKFVGNEAGSKYYYLNGGIWPQGNAWYALALIADGKKDEALRFIRKTMTLHGVMSGPNGQPAMYEVRTPNQDDPKLYGTVDKPQFLWAAGWYIYTLYHLFGIRENNWNLAFNTYNSGSIENYKFNIWANGKKYCVNVAGNDEDMKQPGLSTYGVIPFKSSLPENIRISTEDLKQPLITQTNSILMSSEYRETDKTLQCQLKAFSGHKNTTQIISPYSVYSVHVDRIQTDSGWEIDKKNDYYEIIIRTKHKNPLMEFSIEFDR